MAPDISLPRLGGKQFSLREALKQGPAVVAFFKISCPVCQFTLPYLERIYRAYPQGRYTLVGVSQDEDNYTEEFAREFGITFPLALDDVDKYLASTAYDLTNVPTAFLVAPDGEVRLTIVGWDRRDMERLNAEVAKASGIAPVPLFQPGEKVLDSRPG
jgi:peroxiredoxin